MKIGMLWFDNDPKRSLDKKIHAAVEHYVKKYGAHPDMCYVHPKMLPPIPPEVPGVTVRANQSVLPDHIWVGVNNE